MSAVIVKNNIDSELRINHTDGEGAVTLESSELKQIGVGVGQTYQNMTASRSLGVTYTNTTGKPIVFGVVFRANGSTYWQGDIAVQGIGAGEFNRTDGTDTNRRFTLIGIVPNGGTYLANTSGGALNYWFELR